MQRMRESVEQGRHKDFISIEEAIKSSLAPHKSDFPHAQPLPSDQRTKHEPIGVPLKRHSQIVVHWGERAVGLHMNNLVLDTATMDWSDTCRSRGPMQSHAVPCSSMQSHADPSSTLSKLTWLGNL